MKGKNILVIGASRGIGRDVVEYLIEQDANVIAVARSEEKLNELKALKPSNVWIFLYDMTNLECVENIFIYCKEQGLKLDGMVYTAGIVEDIPIKSLEIEDVTNTYTINIFGYIRAAKYFSLKKYSNDGSSIVALSSSASVLCDKGMSVYSSTKASMNAFTSVLSKELVKRKIRVNAVGPVVVETDMYKQAIERIEGYEDSVLSAQPYGVLPTRQVSYLVEFLLSNKAQYITGTFIPISAGADMPL